MSLLKRLLGLGDGFPAILRVYALVPLTVLFIIVTGLTLALPPGPLCDEGMVLFMEGGCDMGESNIFFFSKLGLLVAVNFALVVAWLAGRSPLLPFAPHLCILLFLAWHFRSGGRCDTYYSHPNGSLGQMALEIAAFSVLGLALLRLAQGRRAWFLGLILAAWNAAYVGLFYAWIGVTNHWTWLHTQLLCYSFLLAALVVAAYNRFLRSPVPGIGLAADERELHRRAAAGDR